MQNPTITYPSDSLLSTSPIVDKEEREILDIIKSDYETASEFEPDFHSDAEPPSDKIFEERLVLKEKALRVYKRIVQLGKNLDMPSKYDIVYYRYKSFEKENLEKEQLQDCPLLTHQMGVSSELDDVMIKSIQFMKKGETASFRIEHVMYDKAQYKRLLEKELFYQISLENWETIIDVFGDWKVMKKLKQKGIGQLRFSNVTEIVVSIETRNVKTGEVVFHFENSHPERLDSKLPSYLLELLQCMKEQEEVIFQLSHEYMLQYPDELKSELPSAEMVPCEPYTPFEAILEISINIKQLCVVDDLYRDQTCLKKALNQSYCTSRPDIHSRVYFDYSIFDKNGNCLYDGFSRRLETSRMNELNFEFYEESTCDKHFLDDYSISKVLRTSLRESKKLEEYELTVANPRKIRDGKDYRIIMKTSGCKRIEELLPLRYHVIVYTFSMGDSGYSMEFKEKERFCLDKKPTSIKLLKAKEFKRAKKVLTYMREVLEAVYKRYLTSSKKSLLSLQQFFYC